MDEKFQASSADVQTKVDLKDPGSRHAEATKLDRLAEAYLLGGSDPVAQRALKAFTDEWHNAMLSGRDNLKQITGSTQRSDLMRDMQSSTAFSAEVDSEIDHQVRLSDEDRQARRGNPDESANEGGQITFDTTHGGIIESGGPPRSLEAHSDGSVKVTEAGKEDKWLIIGPLHELTPGSGKDK